MALDNDIVVRDNQVVGCRGRVLVAVIALVVIILFAAGLLFYTLFTQPPQQPAGRAAADSAPTAFAHSDVIRGSFRRPIISSVSAHTIASARSGDRPGPA